MGTECRAHLLPVGQLKRLCRFRGRPHRDRDPRGLRPGELTPLSPTRAAVRLQAYLACCGVFEGTGGAHVMCEGIEPAVSGGAGDRHREIGRASCRERGVSSVWAYVRATDGE